MPTTAFAQNAIPSALLCIAQHESGGEQFNSQGAVIESPTHDYGLFQINERWLPTAEAMGLDVINSAKDNAEFAIWLANTHGYSQWVTFNKFCSGNDTS